MFTSNWGENRTYKEPGIMLNLGKLSGDQIRIHNYEDIIGAKFALLDYYSSVIIE